MNLVEQQLRTVVKNSPLMVFALNRQGEFTLAEGKALDSPGGLPEVLIGQSIFEVYSDLPSMLQGVRDGLEGRPASAQLDVGEFTFEVRYDPIRDLEGAILGVVGVAYDITALKRAEKDLADSRAQLSVVLDTAGEGIITVDSTGTIVMANQEVQDIWGFRRGELIGRHLRNLMADDYMEIDIGGLHSGIPGHQLELEGIRKDGTTFPLEAKISETRLDQRLFFTAAVRDITERKKVEQDLQRARDGTFEASRVKSEFLASMSHEIRTPMNAILGMSELLAESGLNADQREYLRVATTAGHHLLAVINDILDLSKIEAGQLHLEETDFDLYELVESTAEIMALRAHEKGLELTCDIGREVPQWVCGDPVRLRQLITNLLGNATKFTELGEVGLWVRCESGGESGSIVFSVSDTGIGIPPHKLDSIFGSFAQADSSTTRQYGGTGLGLSICKRLVQMMSGRIWVESEVGRGSTFHFTGTFEVETAPQGVDKAPCKDMAGLRALVLDDSATSRGILQEVLASMGASVVLASRADDALEQLEFAKAQGHPYQLLLLDTRMPEEDGFQVAQRIKAGPGLPVTTVMMLTSEDRASDIGRCEKMGISQHIVKPVKRIDLLRAIGTDIPQVPAALPWDEEQPPSPEDLPPVRILVVEDSEDNRLLVSSYLKPSPCQLDFAENGEVALNKFTAGHYDVVLMDVQMPVMDGYTATRAIREWERRHLMDPTPIIALTAHAMNEDVVKSISAGCTDHITKPIKKGLLMQTIYQYSRNLAFSRGES